MSTEEFKSQQASAALAEGAKEVTQKYTEEAWNAAEKKLSDFDTNVLKTLIGLGTGETHDSSDDQLRVMGEELYLLIRQSINVSEHGRKITLIDKSTYTHSGSDSESKSNSGGKGKGKKKKGKKKGAKSKGPKMKKIDLMRLENAKSTVVETIKTITDTFSTRTLTPYRSFASDILEIRGLGLMYCIWFINSQKDKYGSKGSEDKHYPFVLSIIIAAERFLRSCNEYMGRDMVIPGKESCISPTMISDMRTIHAQAKTIYPYDGFTIYNHAPQLLIYSDYDKCIPSKGITARKNQSDVITFVKKNFSTGFLLSYEAMIASGKTTCSIALITFVQHMRATHAQYANMEFIFCCNLASVKFQVAQMCYNMDVPFGMAHVERDGTAKIINNFKCPSDEARVCIIGSPDAIALILADHSKGNPKDKYFLFDDEPTIGADMKGSGPLHDNVSVMSRLPKWTVLSSATMPELSVLTPFTDKFMEDHPTAVMDTVYSDEIQIGCDVMTTDLNPVIPHMGCETGESLSKVIATIKKNPFLGRIYTHNAARTIWTLCTELGIPGIPNIPEIFKDVDNLSADNVRKYVMKMLDIVAEQPDELVVKVCSTPISESRGADNLMDDESDSDSDGGMVWERDEDEPVDDGDVDYHKLGTTQAYRFLHMNLVATLDPFTFAIEKFRDLLRYLKENEESPVHSAKSIISKFKKETGIYNAKIERLEKNVDNAMELSKQIDELRSDRPKIKFPASAQINTARHIYTFSPGAVGKINKRFVRSTMTLEDIPYDSFSVPDNIALLLFCGVGIYSPGNRMLDQNYTNTVLNLAESGSLAYLIADGSICYGTNYPINRVFVLKDFSDHHSINTLFQLLGRAGRVGRSWKAEAFVHPKCALSVLEYAHDPEAYNSEKENMIELFNGMQQAKEDDIMAEIARMEAELIQAEAKAQQEEEDRKSKEQAKLKLVKVADVITKPAETNNTWKGATWRRDSKDDEDTDSVETKPKRRNAWRRGNDKDSSSGPGKGTYKPTYYSAKGKGFGRGKSKSASRDRSDTESDSDQKKQTKKYVPPHLRKTSTGDKKPKSGHMSWRRG